MLHEFPKEFTRHHASELMILRICLKYLPTRLNRDNQSPGQPSFLRPPFAIHTSTGILTCFPSTTHFCLALGADSPCADYRCAGNLGLSACGVFTRIYVTHVSIRTSDTSSIPYRTPSTAYRTLLYHFRFNSEIHCFGYRFEPRSFFRADRLD